MPHGITTPRFSFLRLLIAVAAATLSLTLVQNGRAADSAPVISLGPVSVLNGTVTVSGNVGGDSVADVVLTVNGSPVGVNANGQFTGSVNLGGESALNLTLKNPTNGETARISIPINTKTVGPDGLIRSDVLKPLTDAGINIIRPLEGFKIFDGQPLKLEGSVLEKDKLASLTVNGKDVLATLRPDGSFDAPVSGTSREVNVTATDRQGVSQTSSFTTVQASSVIATSAGRSVAAKGASGVRITSVRYLTKNLVRTGKVTMIVTVKDRRGLLVRGAKVRIRGVARTVFLTLKGAQTKTTSKIGRATFTIKLNKRVLTSRLKTKRFVVASIASTPNASTSLVTSFRLPARRSGR